MSSAGDVLRALQDAWKNWSIVGNVAQTQNTQPRPFHEYPRAQTELFRRATIPEFDPGPGPPRIANTVPATDVFDGVDLPGLAFRYRTLTLIATNDRDPASFDFDSGRPAVASATNPSGSICVDVRGMQPGGVYWRRFDLTPYKAIEINVQTWRRIRVLPLFSTLAGFDLVAILTEEPANHQRDRVFFAQTLVPTAPFATSQVWEVPPGAVSVFSTTAQAGAAWRSLSALGIPVTVPIAGGAGLAVGVRELVQGSQLVLSPGDVGGGVIWEIEL